MSEWKETTLTDLCTEISYGYTESAKQEKVGPKFLRITDIASGRLDWANVPYCPITDSNFDKYKLLPGDIVIARTGATTGANYTIKETDPKDVVFASYLIRYKINIKKANPYFIGQILQSSNWKDYVDAIAGGSAQPGANAKQLGSFDILLPPLPEQTAIASILSSLDDKIDLLHRQNATLEKMAETLFRQWFVEEEWNGTLSEYIKVQGGFAFKSKDFKEKGFAGVIKIRNIKMGMIDISNTDYVDQEVVNNIDKRFKITSGDFLIAMTGAEIGKIGIVEKTEKEIWVNQRVGKLEAKVPYGDLIGYLALKSREGQDHIINACAGSAQENISSSGIEEMSFIPYKAEITNSLGKEIEPLFKKIIFNQSQIRTLTSLRDTLLPKLMSGEVRVEY